MQQTIRNMPIPCAKCGTMVRGTEKQVKYTDKVVTECTWRCSRCGSYLKKGITKIETNEKK